MTPKYISCFLVVLSDGSVSRTNEVTHSTLDAAQIDGEYQLPSLTAALAPAKVILMIREIAA